jgi:histidinol-phosphate aminotransferase
VSQEGISRRQFARTLGTTLVAAVAAPTLVQDAAGRRLVASSRGENILLNANENPYGPSPKALDAITESERVAARYPDDLYAQTIEAIARLHGIARENIALGCGSTEILRVCDAAFVGGERNLVVAEPTFEAVTYYAQATRAEAVKIPLTAEFRHDLPRMAAACTSRTGLVYVCNPNNPTGTIVSRDELAGFLKRVPASTMILVDEAYHHFVEDPSYASALEWMGKLPNLVVARTFSKVYGMAGMRLGYAVGAQEAIRAMQRHLLQDNGNAAVLASALASLSDADHVPRNRKLLNDTRRWLCQELKSDGRRIIPSEANFVMIDVGGDVAGAIEEFRARKILVGRKFPSLGNWLRVSMGRREEIEAFLAALREIVPAHSARAA